MHFLVIGSEYELHFFLKNIGSVGFRLFHKVFYSLYEEPCGVPGVKAGVLALIVKVGDEAVAHCPGEIQNGLAGFFFEAWGDEQSAQTDECVSAPTSHETSREMGQTCCH